MTELEKHIDEIKQLCKHHKVKKLYVIGSILTSKFDNESDIDFIVDFEPVDLNQYADNYYELKFSLQNILHRPIDLLEEKAIRNPYFKQATENQRKLVYGY